MNAVIRRALFPLTLACAFALNGCSSKSSGAGGGEPPGGDSGADSGGNGQFLGSGTFTASGDDAGSASAKLSGFQMTLAQVLTLTDGYDFDIAANPGDGTSSATFSSPSGITSYTFNSDVVFSGAPQAGQTFTISNSCGATGIVYGTMTEQLEYDYTARNMGTNCPVVTGSDQGTWTLTLSAVTLVSNTVGNVYTAHGTFTSTMPDGMGGTGIVNFTF